MTKKSVGLRNHSTLIIMFKCFFLMKIKYKDLIHELLPFIAQEQLAQQGKAYAWSLYHHNN